MKIVHSVAFFRSPQSGYETPNAGTSQGIFFLNFIELLIKAHFAAFKGWELWIHHDNRVKDFECWPYLTRLHRAGIIKLVDMGESKELCASMLWRLAPIWDKSVDVVVCRDVDSLPMHRDRKMVEEFIESKADVHAILDSESHSGPLMGGMVSFKTQAFREKFPNGLESILAEGGPAELFRHGGDQRLLNGMVWPRMASQTLIHQRRNDIQYPEAMETRRAAPQVTELDKVIRHIGAAYPREKAEAVIDEHYPYELVSGVRPLEMLKSLKWPQQEKPTDEAKPWYTPGAIEFLPSLLKRDWPVLEFGGGASSEWYRNRCDDVVTVEEDPLWVEMIRQRASKVDCVPFNHAPMSDHFDFVAIDGNDRLARVRDCAKSFLLKDGGYLLLDNSEEYPEAGEILKGWERHDFKHPEKAWTTTIWRKPS